jgi:hypothetical protein
VNERKKERKKDRKKEGWLGRKKRRQRNGIDRKTEINQMNRQEG